MTDIVTTFDHFEELLANLRIGPDLWADEDRSQQAHEEPPRYIDGWSFITRAGAAVEPLWGSDDRILWAQGESLILVGGQGVGKSTLAQQLVLHAIGIRPGDLLGFPVAAAQRVLYLAMDRPRQIARSLRRMVTEDEADVLADRLTIWPGPPPEDLAKDANLFCKMCQQAEATVLIVDSLKDVAIRLSEDEVGGTVNRAIQSALQAGIEVVVLHHQRKAASGTVSKPKSLDEVYGSTWITSGAGSVVLLWGDPGDAFVELSHLKQPSLEVGPLKLYHDHITGTSTAEDQFNLWAYLQGQPRPVGASDVARAQSGRYEVDRSERERARRLLEAMVAKGAVVKIPGRRGGSGGGDESTYCLPTITGGEP